MKSISERGPGQPLVSSCLVSFCCPGSREAAGGSSPPAPEGGRRAVGHPGPPSAFRGSRALAWAPALPCASSTPGLSLGSASALATAGAPAKTERRQGKHLPHALSSRSPCSQLAGVGPRSVQAAPRVPGSPSV